jgi:hypothetical protein
MPWSNNNMYFDAGNATGYDRINKVMSAAEIQGQWNHWACVKKQTTGQMFIFKNGHLWHSGTNLNRTAGYIHRFILGASADQSIKWKGQLDEFRVYNIALDSTTIQAHYQKKIDNSHPNFSNLMVYYDFDDVNYAKDRTPNDFKLMLSDGFDLGNGSMIKEVAPVAGVQMLNERPVIAFGQGIVSGGMQSSTLLQPLLREPITIFEQAPVHRHFEIVNSFQGVEKDTSYVFNQAGSVVSSNAFGHNVQWVNDSIFYFQKPYEIINDVEIARYITPYGINFDLGPNGFAWIYDVTANKVSWRVKMMFFVNATAESIRLLPFRLCKYA